MGYGRATAMALALLLGGCASGAPPCPAQKTGGWFSGWGSGSNTAFTMGVRRTFGECAERTATPAGRPPDFGPPLPPDPLAEPPDPRTPASSMYPPR